MTDNLLFLVFIVCIGILMLVIGFFMLFHKSQLKIAEQQKRFHEEQVLHHQNLLKAAVASQDLERKRVGKDLHDSIGTSLAVLRLAMENFERLHQVKDSHLQKFFLECKTKIDFIVHSCRNISHNLSPEIFTLNTLSESIEELAASVFVTEGVHLEADQSTWNYLDTLTEEQAINLYRILEELLNNTIKHANASSIFVYFRTQDQRLHIKYHDDGCGIKEQVRVGHGVQHIESRILVLDGKYEVEEKQTPGYNLHFSFPLNN